MCLNDECKQNAVNRVILKKYHKKDFSDWKNLSDSSIRNLCTIGTETKRKIYRLKTRGRSYLEKTCMREQVWDESVYCWTTTLDFALAVLDMMRRKKLITSSLVGKRRSLTSVIPLYLSTFKLQLFQWFSCHPIRQRFAFTLIENIINLFWLPSHFRDFDMNRTAVWYEHIRWLDVTM